MDATADADAHIPHHVTDDIVAIQRNLDAAASMLQFVAAMWLEEESQRTRARALVHWKTMRFSVKTHPYAWHWYEHICTQLCAPGGMWAERDRAAFQVDFN